jgi:two-component system sensor histidine kinase PrrB
MRSLRARVAVAAVAATAAAFLLSGLVVVGTFAWEFHRPGAPAVTDHSGFLPAFAVRLGVVNLVVLALVGLAGLRLGGAALRPLVALRSGAERVASTRDLATRLPQDGGPEEVRSLADSLNAMLERLQQSTEQTEATLQSSRRFAADAGHELRTPLTSMRANLDVLARSSTLGSDERQILADIAREQNRLIGLLDGLQRLARGDAAEAVPKERIDLAEVADAAVASGRDRHPAATISLAAPDQVVLDGWAEGLRVLIDNLLDNAALHGRRGGQIEVMLEVDGSTARLTVDDDGPGIPIDQRRRVLERFARGTDARAPGSGLGLALVEQQALAHGGRVSIGNAPLGGARITVNLPIT